MKRAGKAHWLVIAGLASLVVVAALFAFGRDSAGDAAHDFMSALAKGDVDKLTELSYYPGASKDELKKKWDFTVHKAGKYYRFLGRIVNVTQTDNENAAAVMQITRNADGGGYEEKFQLPLVKEGDEWKVDVRAISRSMYPGLPR